MIKLSKIILASTSPRRKELLAEITEFIPMSPNLDEEGIQVEDPVIFVLVSAYLKARSIFVDHPEAKVIGADTVVVLDGKILGKPHSREEAFQYLKSLSGRSHQVLTSYAVLSSEEKLVNLCTSEVRFKSLTNEEIETYLDTGEYADKAGAYAIQGEGRALIEGYEGSLTNIIGLPIKEIEALL